MLSKNKKTQLPDNVTEVDFGYNEQPTLYNQEDTVNQAPIKEPKTSIDEKVNRVADYLGVDGGPESRGISRKDIKIFGAVVLSVLGITEGSKVAWPTNNETVTAESGDTISSLVREVNSDPRISQKAINSEIQRILRGRGSSVIKPGDKISVQDLPE